MKYRHRLYAFVDDQTLYEVVQCWSDHDAPDCEYFLEDERGESLSLGKSEARDTSLGRLRVAIGNLKSRTTAYSRDLRAPVSVLLDALLTRQTPSSLCCHIRKSET